MLVLLFLILWPVAELFVAIKVAEAIGVLLTVVLLIAELAARGLAAARRGPGRLAAAERRRRRRSSARLEKCSTEHWSSSARSC